MHLYNNASCLQYHCPSEFNIAFTDSLLCLLLYDLNHRPLYCYINDLRIGIILQDPLIYRYICYTTVLFR